MDASKSVSATFLEASSVNIERVGSDPSASRVVSDPAGIDCPGACSADFAVGTNVSLTASAAADVTFTGWSGDPICPGLASCMFAVAVAPTAVRATFNVTGEHVYDILSNVDNPSSGQGESVAFDPAGNLFIAGSFGIRLAFGTTSVTSMGSGDVFIAKIDPGGGLVWLRSFGGVSNDSARSVQVDALGNAYLVLFHSGDITVGGTHTGQGLVVAKLAGADGAVQWSRTAPRFGGASGGRAYVAIGQDGGPIIGGHTQSTALGFFVQWYSPSGDIGDTVFFGSDNDELNGMVADGAGNVVLAGTFSNTVDFNGNLPGGTISAVGGRDVFLAKVGQGNSLSWSRALGGATDDLLGGVAVSPDGDVWIAGQFQGTFDLGGTPLIATGTDTYLAKYAPNGDHVHSYRVDANIGRTPQLAVDVRGNVSVIGEFGGGGGGTPVVDLGGGPIVAIGGSKDLVFGNFDAQGQHRWSRGMGGTIDFVPTDAALGLGVDSTGRLAVTGRISDGADFGGGPVTASAAAQTVFAVVYGP